MKIQSMNRTSMSQQGGFTLVELIIVIVILGILAVVAAPRFLNLQGDANAATLEGVRGSIRSGMNIVNGKAIIANVQNRETAIVEGVRVAYGYPQARLDAFEAFLDINFAVGNSGQKDSQDFNLIIADDGTGDSPGKVVIFPNSYSYSSESDNDSCYVTYTAASGPSSRAEDSANAPVTTIDTSGC